MRSRSHLRSIRTGSRTGKSIWTCLMPLLQRARASTQKQLRHLSSMHLRLRCMPAGTILRRARSRSRQRSILTGSRTGGNCWTWFTPSLQRAGGSIRIQTRPSCSSRKSARPPERIFPPCLFQSSIHSRSSRSNKGQTQGTGEP